MRFQCSQHVIERFVPPVNPGVLQTPHMHWIVGGNSFNATMLPVTYDPAQRSTCLACFLQRRLLKLLDSVNVLPGKEWQLQARATDGESEFTNEGWHHSLLHSFIRWEG